MQHNTTDAHSSKKGNSGFIPKAGSKYKKNMWVESICYKFFIHIFFVSAKPSAGQKC